LKRAISKYLEIDEALNSKSDISKETLNFLSKSPILSLKSVSTFDSNEINFREESNEIVINKIYGYLSKDDADYFLNPGKKLTTELIKDLNQYLMSSHICFIFDRYETVDSLINEWLEASFFANLEKYALFVFSGRYELPIEWNGWRQMIKKVELSTFLEKDTFALLELLGITNNYLLEQVCKFSNGLPLAISLAADLIHERGESEVSFSSNKYKIIEDVVEVLIKNASPQLERTIEVCSVLRWFNEDSIKFILKKKYNEAAFKKIKNFDFIRRGTHGFEMHDRVRDFINQDLSNREPVRYQEINILAAEYYTTLLNNKIVSNHRMIKLESLYHQLLTDDKQGFSNLRKEFTDAALLIQPSYCQTIVQMADKIGLIKDEYKLWIEYYYGFIARQNSDFVKAEKLFSKLAEKTIIEQFPELKAELFYNWGVALWYCCAFEKSLKVSKLALELNQELGKNRFINRSLGVIGLSQDRQGNFDDGLVTVDRMVNKAQESNDKISEAYGLNSIGYFGWHAGKWKIAEDAFLKQRKIWMDLGSKFGECYCLGHLGRLYADIGYYTESRNLLIEGLEATKESGNKEMEIVVLTNIAALDYYQNEFESAICNVEEALKIVKKVNHKYYVSEASFLLGDIYYTTGEIEKSEEQYTLSLEHATELSSKWMIFKNQVCLFNINLSNNLIDQSDYNTLLSSGTLYKYNDQLAELNKYMGNWFIKKSDLSNSIKYYSLALLYAVKYNWHYLNKIMCDILNHLELLQTKSQFNNDLLNSLIKFWESPLISKEKPISLEKNASRIFKGSSKNNPPLIERFEKMIIKIEN